MSLGSKVGQLCNKSSSAMFERVITNGKDSQLRGEGGEGWSEKERGEGGEEGGREIGREGGKERMKVVRMKKEGDVVAAGAAGGG